MINKFFTYLWYKGNLILSIPFLPLSLLFFLIIVIRKFLHTKILKRYVSKNKVIIIGNLSVGGSGKTPFTIWLSNYLKKNKKRFSIVSSGYGSNISSPQIINDKSDPHEVGDEAVLIHKLTDNMTVSSNNRVQSNIFCDQYDLDYVIHDDGLQHYRLSRDYEFIIVKNEKIKNKFLLPSGPFREPCFFHPHGKFISSNYYYNDIPGFYSKISSIKNALTGESLSIEDNRFKNSLLITAIADNRIIIEELKKYKINLQAINYPDHYRFKKSDFDELKLPVLVTEKDFVKIKKLNLKNIFILEQIIVPNGKLIELVEKLL